MKELHHPGGVIRANSIGKLIMGKDKVDVSKTKNNL